MTQNEQKECEAFEARWKRHNQPVKGYVRPQQTEQEIAEQWHGAGWQDRAESARTQQAAVPDEQRRAGYVINVAVSSLRSVDKVLKDDGWRVDEGSTREKIKHSINELERLRTAQPDKAEVVERVKQAIRPYVKGMLLAAYEYGQRRNRHISQLDKLSLDHVAEAALSALPPQHSDSGLVDIEKALCALLHVVPTKELWDKAAELLEFVRAPDLLPSLAKAVQAKPGDA